MVEAIGLRILRSRLSGQPAPVMAMGGQRHILQQSAAEGEDVFVIPDAAKA